MRSAVFERRKAACERRLQAECHAGSRASSGALRLFSLPRKVPVVARDRDALRFAGRESRFCEDVLARSKIPAAGREGTDQVAIRLPPLARRIPERARASRREQLTPNAVGPTRRRAGGSVGPTATAEDGPPRPLCGRRPDARGL